MIESGDRGHNRNSLRQSKDAKNIQSSMTGVKKDRTDSGFNSTQTNGANEIAK